MKFKEIIFQAGAYMCESSNKVGKGRSEDIILDVKCEFNFLLKFFILVLQRGFGDLKNEIYLSAF